MPKFNILRIVNLDKMFVVINIIRAMILIITIIITIIAISNKKNVLYLW